MQTRAADLTTIQKSLSDDVFCKQGQDILQILKSVANDLPSLKSVGEKIEVEPSACISDRSRLN